MFLIINLSFLRKRSHKFLENLHEDRNNVISSFVFIPGVFLQYNKSIIKYAAFINACILTVFNDIGGYPTTDVIFQCIKLRKPIYDYIKIAK